MKQLLQYSTNKLTGNVSGLWGDVSGLWGDVSGLWGDVDLCELTDEERAREVNIRFLVRPLVSRKE